MLANIPTPTLRDAARAWRAADVTAQIYLTRSGWFKWLATEPNMSLHDRIDDLVNEIDRLRRNHGAKDIMEEGK